ncbi:MAG: mechanosensitive ion channel family protein [Marinagarivorans sp.]|nr:mechanosensitive ion channel family protein [Marinagarivorans sp.]
MVLIGRWLIGVAVGMVRSSLERQKLDPTVLRYVGSIVTVTLNILLVIGILGYFGIQTTTFAALIAAAGVAIGMAWSGLLAHFAAGAFLVVLRPMKVGGRRLPGCVAADEGWRFRDGGRRYPERSPNSGPVLPP